MMQTKCSCMYHHRDTVWQGELGLQCNVAAATEEAATVPFCHACVQTRWHAKRAVMKSGAG